MAISHPVHQPKDPRSVRNLRLYVVRIPYLVVAPVKRSTTTTAGSSANRALRAPYSQSRRYVIPLNGIIQAIPPSSNRPIKCRVHRHHNEGSLVKRNYIDSVHLQAMARTPARAVHPYGRRHSESRTPSPRESDSISTHLSSTVSEVEIPKIQL